MNETFKHKIKTTALILLSTVLVAACAAFGLSYLSADGNTQTASAETYDTALVDAWNTAVSSSSETSASTFTLTKNWVATESGFGEGAGFGANYAGALYVPVNKSVVLDLNGYTLDRNLSTVTTWGCVIFVVGSLTIMDSSSAQTGLICGGYNGNYGGGIAVSGGKLVIYSGTISNNRASMGGGGVYLINKVTFTMNGGTISENECGTGSGVYVNSNATFTINDGTMNGALYVAESGNYNYVGGTVSNITISKTKLTDTTQNVSTQYDGLTHKITVSATGFNAGDSLSKGYVKYGLTEGVYNLSESPLFGDSGTHTVYYRVIFANTYATITGSATVTITGILLDKSNSVVSAIENQTYAGGEIKPTVTVTYVDHNSARLLTLNTDYTVSYSNNVNVGTATVTITGKGNFAGTTTTTFDITKATLTTTASSYSGVYDGMAHDLVVSPTGFLGSDTFENTATVKYGYTPTSCTNSTMNIKSASSGYTLIYYVATFDNYNTITGNGLLSITPRSLETDTVFSSISNQTYAGVGIEPAFTVSNSGLATTSKTLNINTDYTVSYSNNVNVGTATVTITGKGNFAGTASTTFEIVKATLTDTTQDNDFVYTGGSFGLFHISATGFKGSDTFDGTATVKYGTSEGTYNSYSPSYIKTGTYKVYYQITFDNYNTITGSANVIISQRNFATFKPTVTLTGTSGYIYTGSAITPTYSVSDSALLLTDKALVLNRDYTAEYTNNVNAGTAGITLTGIGNFTGTYTKTFSIAKATLTDKSSGYVGVYTGAAHGITVSATGFKSSDTFANTATVKYGTSSGSYTLSASPTYSSAGTHIVYYQITFTNYATIESSKTVSISKVALTDTTQNVEAAYDGLSHGITVSATGFINSDTFASTATVKYGTSSGSYTLSESPMYSSAGAYTIYYQVTFTNYNTITGSKTVTIKPRDISYATATVTGEYEYTGSEITPEFTVKDDGLDVTLAFGTDYTVSCTDNVEVGTATIVFTGTGNYTGTISQTFEIAEAAETPVDPEEPDEPDVPVDPEEPDEPDVPVDPEEPDEPDVPVDPEEPDEPDEPVEPENPDQTGGEDSGESGKPDAGKKVHPAAIAVPVAVVVVGAIVASVVVLFKKRKK